MRCAHCNQPVDVAAARCVCGREPRLVDRYRLLAESVPGRWVAELGRRRVTLLQGFRQATDVRAASRFAEAARRLSSLRHRAIPPLIDAFHTRRPDGHRALWAVLDLGDATPLFGPGRALFGPGRALFGSGRAPLGPGRAPMLEGSVIRTIDELLEVLEYLERAGAAPFRLDPHAIVLGPDRALRLLPDPFAPERAPQPGENVRLVGRIAAALLTGHDPDDFRSGPLWPGLGSTGVHALVRGLIDARRPRAATEVRNHLRRVHPPRAEPRRGEAVVGVLAALTALGGVRLAWSLVGGPVEPQGPWPAMEPDAYRDPIVVVCTADRADEANCGEPFREVLEEQDADRLVWRPAARPPREVVVRNDFGAGTDGLDAQSIEAVSRVWPVYPETARLYDLATIACDVDVRVGADGAPTGATTHCPAVFASSALDALAQWRWPRQPEPALVRIRVKFVLHGD